MYEKKKREIVGDKDIESEKIERGLEKRKTEKWRERNREEPYYIADNQPLNCATLVWKS